MINDRLDYGPNDEFLHNTLTVLFGHRNYSPAAVSDLDRAFTLLVERLAITDAMVETAAAAIDTEWADEPNRDPPFDELDTAYKNHCRATARAALEAVFGATEKT